MHSPVACGGFLRVWGISRIAADHFAFSGPLLADSTTFAARGIPSRCSVQARSLLAIASQGFVTVAAHVAARKGCEL